MIVSHTFTLVFSQENDISFVDCENMVSLRVLQLAHNKLTSIHGLHGAENLGVLDLSHNSITRIGENCLMETSTLIEEKKDK